MGKIISNAQINSRRIKEGKNTLKVLIKFHNTLLRTVTPPILYDRKANVKGHQQSYME